MIVFKKFTFDAAHRLHSLGQDHRCNRIHGHTFHLELRCKGCVNPETGMVVAYETIKEIVCPILEDLDHQYLNDIPGLTLPTTENLAVYLWDKIKPKLNELSEIYLQETATAGVIYNGS